MIEKLKTHQIVDNNGVVIGEREPDITELREAINEIIDFLDKQIKDTYNVLPKSMRMEKEFAEDECKRLQQELTKTEQALDLATDWLEQVATLAKCDDDLCREFTKRKLAEIKTALEQKS